MNEVTLTVMSVRQEVHLNGGGVVTNTLVMSLPNGDRVEAVITDETLQRIVNAHADEAPKQELPLPPPPSTVEEMEDEVHMIARGEYNLGNGVVGRLDEGRDDNAVFDESGVAQG